MPLIRSGLGEDFNASVAKLVVFRGKGILVDANFADGGFGGKLPAREAVDIDLPAIGACGGAGKRLQVGLQVVRIVGKRVQIFPL